MDKDIKPSVGTESCQAKHIGVIVEGSVTCRHDDGTEITYSAGSAYASNQDMMPGLTGYTSGFMAPWLGVNTANTATVANQSALK